MMDSARHGLKTGFNTSSAQTPANERSMRDGLIFRPSRPFLFAPSSTSASNADWQHGSLTDHGPEGIGKSAAPEGGLARAWNRS